MMCATCGVVDVVGSIDPAYATYDSQGHAINDPWPTAFASSGFDFDAVGVLHAVPEPGTIALLGLGMLLLIAPSVASVELAHSLQMSKGCPIFGAVRSPRSGGPRGRI